MEKNNRRRRTRIQPGRRNGARASRQRETVQVREGTPDLEIITPEQDEVQVDLDGPQAVKNFNRRLACLRRWARLDGWLMCVRPSRSGERGHYHVTIKLPVEVVTKESILIASLLGSDPIREIINYVRVNQDRPYPICFFRTKNVRREADKYRPIAEIGP